MAKKILIADDDPHIRDVVSFALEKAGMTTLLAKDGREVMALFRAEAPDLIVLDINMPEMDGLDVCRELRKTADVPVLFLSSRDEEVDRVVGLEIGGDDYMTKPFSPRELVARINSVLKRSTAMAARPAQEEASLQRGLIVLAPEKFQVLFGQTPVLLTATEFGILKGMLRHPDHVFDRDRIIDVAYRDNMHVSDRTIDSHIRHIRQKFAEAGCDSVIETVHGVGYRLGPCR